MPWYALYTKPRHEKKVNQLLLEKNQEVYLPVIARISQWKDRKKKVDEPLFKSYIFSNFKYKYRFDVLQTDGVVKIVNFHGEPAVVPDWQIESLKKMLEFPQTLRLENFIRTGELAEVIAGPLAGMKGTVLRRKGTSRLVLTIDGIMQSVSVEIDEGCLRKV
jgi:transcription antitermination factor NusG